MFRWQQWIEYKKASGESIWTGDNNNGAVLVREITGNDKYPQKEINSNNI